MTRSADVARLTEAVERLFTLLLRQGGALGGAEPTPLSNTQRLALAVAVDEGPLRLGALAAGMGTTDATATRTVDGLVHAGLVERVADPEDRRCVLVGPTEAGRQSLAERRRLLGAMVERLLAEVAGEDLARLADLVADLNAILSGVEERVAAVR